MLHTTHILLYELYNRNTKQTHMLLYELYTTDIHLLRELYSYNAQQTLVTFGIKNIDIHYLKLH